MAAAAIFGFLNRKILSAIGVQNVETHQHARFCQNRSIGCEEINIFRFFKMAAGAMLDFPNREFLYAVGIWRAQSHHCTKFHQNRSLVAKITRIFRFFKIAAVRHLGSV